MKLRAFLAEKLKKLWASDKFLARNPVARPHFLAPGNRDVSTAIDHDSTGCKILETAAIRGNDDRGQCERYQECAEHRSRQSERLHIQPHDGDAAQQLPEAAACQPGQYRGLNEENGQDHPRPPATAGEYARAEQADGDQHACGPIDDQRADTSTPAR
jgi:hypothetical protein